MGPQQEHGGHISTGSGDYGMREACSSYEEDTDMAILDGLRSLFRPKYTYVYGGDYGVNVANMNAAELYKTQPNLRAVISFLADNAAQVPIKVYDRVSETDRRRILDSPAALLLQNPNEDMTAFEFKRWMYSDLLLYERFLTLIVPSKYTPSGWELRPIPANWIQSFKGSSPFAPEAIVICALNCSTAMTRRTRCASIAESAHSRRPCTSRSSRTGSGARCGTGADDSTPI